MSRRWITTAATDRSSVVIDNAELLADEACDVGLFTEADGLRLRAARLGKTVEEGEARDADSTRIREVRRRSLELLRRTSHRFCLELESKLAAEDAYGLLTTARLSVEPSMRYRLGRITPAPRVVLGTVVDDATSALTAFHQAELRTFEAASCAYIARARVLAMTCELRSESQRFKAMLLLVIPQGTDAFRRVSRLVVRTRRPDAWLQKVLK